LIFIWDNSDKKIAGLECTAISGVLFLNKSDFVALIKIVFALEDRCCIQPMRRPHSFQSAAWLEDK